MKKFQKLLVISIAVLLMNIAHALEIVDVRSDYWAGQEIVRAIQNGYIGVIDGNKFKPEGTMTRSEFVTSLLKVIGRQDEAITQVGTSFKDISYQTPNLDNVVLSEQIRMAFGYPDKTFKPVTPINHNETMSMIANISKPEYIASNITVFKDYKDIPLWARRAWIKNVANGFYVNHPDALSFTPSNNLTRAEAAVLFDKIASNLDKIQDNYKNLYQEAAENDFGWDFDKAEYIGENTLNLASFATNNKVQVYDKKLIIEAGNILIGTALDLVETRKDLVGHEYRFVAPADVYTQQGTFLYPKGTEFYARVDKIGFTSWRSRPETSRVVFHKYSLPNGQTYDMAGVPFTKNDKVIYVNDVRNLTKAKKLASPNTKRKEQLIDLVHQMAPNIEYKLKENKTIYILLTGDMVIPISEDYFHLREKKSNLEIDRRGYENYQTDLKYNNR